MLSYLMLENQVITARVTLENLSELCENPLKGTKRWRQLKGRTPKAMELEQKVWAIQVFIDQKEDQATEKDIILDEVNQALAFTIHLTLCNIEKIKKISIEL